MHRSSQDANLGAAADSELGAHVVDIVVLTTDGGLLATLREVCGPQHAIWHAQTAEAGVDLLVGGRCGILVADLGTLRGDVASLLERLHAQFPELVLIASGRRDEEHVVANLMSDGRVYRFLHKPLSPARASLFVTAATRRYAELRHVEPLMITTVKALAARRNWGAIIAGSLAVAGAIALLVLWWSSKQTAAPAFTSGSYATDSSRQIEDAIGRAQIAYLAGRLAEPKGDNALEYFQTVLALQPEHADAVAGVERVVAALESRVVKALEERDAAKGVVALTRLQRAQADHPRLDQLRADLIALARGVSSEPAPEPIAAPQLPAPPVARPSSIQAARTNLALDRLIEPADNNALIYLRRARDVGESQSLIAIAATDLGMRLIAKAREAIAVRDDVQAQRWADAATLVNQEFALALPDLEAVTQEVGALTRTLETTFAEDIAAAAAFRERGQLIEPARANAYDRLIAVRAKALESTEFLAEQQRLVFALLEAARTALTDGDLDRAEAFADRADALLPGMTTTQSLLHEIGDLRGQRSDSAENP